MFSPADGAMTAIVAPTGASDAPPSRAASREPDGFACTELYRKRGRTDKVAGQPSDH
jgi:hypothetical protein